ncbi:hypothetical protein A2738_03365 [Candidatus Nomurabacteria bacterium RIFCSPHIGHO2_01_FULL_42_15]|uniref:Zinc-binding domain-containing protein n=1 Tax=Candidatus Nomurabacteria bacterium RIFCSPHIGHO2_01_FULL_42_15 TaxID=1801742 RepID=A0A1F6VE06_9BACT|nr:MAG: hypothetical protein A2738_03365 [Candidatus Nomurabacteria bacterium RIFCSPHIGHO2_01_FULL_42_15]OGI93235.1 MAG: hypothetical protein A3A99_03200 [Candidatus Nomurabacteria bacterium RIFCSPLOWO2_01_FULL_41_18]
MEPEIKLCQNCKKEFTIEPEDFKFYEKMQVLAPTWCPECRLVRRLSFINTWSLHWRNCDVCKEKTLSEYPPEDKIKVYCQKCWWGDSWDGTEYAMDYDSSRPFLEQVKELSDKTPYVALESQYSTLKNSEYSNSIAWSKDCFQVFWADYCEFVYYSSILNGLKFSSDCLRGWESELCYESTGFIRNYRAFFSEESDDCLDVWFSRNCYGCSNCIGCVNLRGASYQIFNVQYSKEEYAEKMKELRFDSWENLHAFEKQAREFWLTKPYREYHGHSLNLNVTGEHIYTSKNCKEMYIANGAENCKWTQLITVKPAKDCMDYTGWGNNASLVYEAGNVGENANNIKFSSLCFPDCLNLEYCIWNISGKNNFGCVNLKRKSYCILNKEYSKEEYEKLKTKIIADMKKNPYVDKLGRKFYYGEFFPLEMGRFPYNKSNAMKFVPKEKEQALKEGYDWAEREDLVYKTTISSDSIPDSISDTDESIIKEVIGCMNCGRGYKIVKGEFDLLKKMNLPIPHECPKCRESRRFARMNRPGMYHRNCDSCKKEIYTPYAPGRPEIVYCVKCYQQEFA